MGYRHRPNYDDSNVRKQVIIFFNDVLGIELNETPQNLKIIDLTGVTETLIGVEVEGGGWTGDFWENDKYSFISGLEFRTLNIPIRKEKYWQESVFRYRKHRPNPSYKHNIFARMNKDFTQILIVRPETIRDPTKIIRTKFQPKNSDDVEEWMSFKECDVETYNLENGNWILKKNHEITQPIY